MARKASVTKNGNLPGNQPELKENMSVASKSKKISVTAEELFELIKNRAFELYLERGGSHGNHENDWYDAERSIKAKYKIKE